MNQKLSRYRVAAIIFLSVLGFSANWFRIELFFHVDFIFGSIFVLLAAARFGVFPGIVTGVLAGSCTWLLWHHPWGIAIGAAEAAVVGLLLRRRTISLLAADTIFWLCCGAPLVWIFYHHVMGVPEQTVLLIALKQSLNGISNAVIAQIFLLALQSHHPQTGQLPRFRLIIFTVMVSLVLFTGMAALVTDLHYMTNHLGLQQHDATLNILTSKSILDMSLLLAVFLLSALIATILSHMFLKPLEELQTITDELAGLIPANLPEERWPVNRVYELDALSSNFKRMVTILSDKFIQQQKTCQELATESEKLQKLELLMIHVREHVEQDERGRISRDLHDSLGQSLQTVKLNLQIIKLRCNDECGSDGHIINDAITEIGVASEELRDIVTMLRPPVLADQSLPEALEWMAKRLSRRSGVTITVVCNNVPGELNEELKVGLFRICQEALSNALKHGNPTAVEIHLSGTAGGLSLNVHDNGSGFDQYSCTAGSGIGIMKERAALLAGTFKLKSYPGAGTGIAVEVSLP